MFQTLSYRELSAWIMSGALLLSGAIYAIILRGFWKSTGEWIVPILPFIAMTIVLILLSIFGHVIGAILMRKSANAASDERDRAIRQRAGHISGNILGFTVLMVLLAMMVNPNGFQLFHAVFACVFISQIAEYILQIVFYRQTDFKGEVA